MNQAGAVRWALDDHSDGAASRSAYRPDIDGLRAIAVLSVVLYHINKAWVPGGYVGVDIFFVISGFLITRNIWWEMRAGEFSLARFYLRRLRRIAPVLLLVTATVLVAGILLLLPEDLVRLARSAVWSALSVGNVYFWRYLDTGYFAAAGDEEPLLHLWSLGVEEQFYLIWPTLLLLFALPRRANKLAVAATTAICIAAFVVAEWTNVSAAKFAYFMLPARAGELMLGALLALRGPTTPAGGGARRRWLGEGIAVAGLALLVFSLWGLDDASPFPGINALYPCFGATLVILSGQLGSRLTTTLLTPRPVIWIGLVSYSLYLWHWPILAFLRYFFGELDLALAAAALVAMLGLSALSYRFVEQPARRLRGRPMRQVLALLVAPIALISMAAFGMIRSEGMKASIDASTRVVAAREALRRQTDPADGLQYPCQVRRPEVTPAILNDSRCVVGANANPGSPPADVLLWGDSNAGHYIGVLRAVAERDAFAFRYLTYPTCPPLFGEGAWGAPYARNQCHQFREGIRQSIQNTSIRTVALAGQWDLHATNPEFPAALARTIDEFKRKGIRVVLLGQVPGFPSYSRECESRWARVGAGRCESRSWRPDSGDTAVNRYLAGLASADRSVSYVGIKDVVCGDGRCSSYLDGKPVYFNATHLSGAGSWQIGRQLVDSDSHAVWRTAFTSASEGRPPAEPAVPTVVSAPASALQDHFQPAFSFRIRSQRHTPAANDQVHHVVIAEYLDVEEAYIVNSLVTELVKQEFAIRGPFRRDGAQRIVARKGPLVLTILVTGTPSVPLIAPGARGIVHFAWTGGPADAHTAGNDLNGTPSPGGAKGSGNSAPRRPPASPR